METNQGWVLLHRKILSHPIAENPVALRIWLECLFRANFQRSKVWRGGEEITLQPGQFLFSRKTWADRMKMRPSTVRDWVEKFKKYEMISLVKSDSNLPTIFQIRNWKNYQLPDSKLTANQQQDDTSKELKEIHTIARELGIPLSKVEEKVARAEKYNAKDPVGTARKWLLEDVAKSHSTQPLYTSDKIIYNIPGEV